MPKINATPIYSGEQIWDMVIAGEVDHEVLKKDVNGVTIRAFTGRRWDGDRDVGEVIVVPVILWNTYAKTIKK